MMKKRILFFVTILDGSTTFVLIRVNRGGEQSSGTPALVNGFVIDGPGEEPVSGGTVLIRGNGIIAVGRGRDVQIPAEARKIDLDGKIVWNKP